MLRSVFLRRILLIVLIALSLSALLASFLFYFASDQTLESNLAREMHQKAEAIAASVQPQDAYQDLQDVEFPAVFLDFNITQAYLLIVDANNQTIASTTVRYTQDRDYIQNLFDYIARTSRIGSDATHRMDILDAQSDRTHRMMIVEVPLFFADEQTGTLVIGSPLTAMDQIQQRLFEVILLTTTMVSFLMLVPIYLATSRLIKPLHKVSDVARAMAQGDFSLRANTKASGEIGELAQSFNDLAEKLSLSISELTLERNKLRQIFDVISDGIVSVDLDLRPIYTNPAIHTLFEKISRKNLFTESLQLIPFQEIWDDFACSILEKKTLERTIESREVIILSTVVPNLDNNDNVIGATGFFRDITESERLEQTRREYVANVSHELRTPLTALRGLVEPLADGMVNTEADRRRYYGIILHETMRLARLIDDMLELSRLQAKTLAFRTFPFDLNKVLEEIETKFTPVMRDADRQFIIESKSGSCPTVMGNPDRVEQILIILIDNAKKYTPEGGTIIISTETDERRERVIVSVVDNGQGIHEYDIDHIFDRFYKADRARGKKGTGLGLSIAKELLNYMGESITVESDYGKGTVFCFTLKIVKSATWGG